MAVIPPDKPTNKPEPDWLDDDTSKAFSMLLMGVLMLILGFVLGRLIP